MAYEEFLDGYPQPNSQNGLQAFDQTRKNLDAMRDSVVMGIMPGWDFAPDAIGDPTPTYHYYTKGQEKIRLTLAWDTNDNLVTMVAAYAVDGVNYDSIGTYTIVYDGDLLVTSATWT